MIIRKVLIPLCVCLLAACSPTKKQEQAVDTQKTTSSSVTTTQTTTKQGTTNSPTKEKNQSTSETTHLTTKETTTKEATTKATETTIVTTEIAANKVGTMDLAAIQSGDFSSVAGTWQNSRGDLMTIAEDGTYTYQDNPDRYQIKIYPTSYQEGTLNWTSSRVDGNSIVGGGTYTFIPKGVTLTYGLVEGHTDQTDKNQDRFFGTQTAMTTESLIASMYYRVP